MTTGTTRGQKPKGLLRFFLRAPIWLYKMGLGWLLGSRFLMFQHIGRKSGQPHQTVVEVVRYDQASDTYIIASGWGKKSDWFRNIKKNPEVVVYAGRRRSPAKASQISQEAATQALMDYARRYPMAFANLSKMMLGQQLEGSEADCQKLAQSVPVVALKLVDRD